MCAECGRLTWREAVPASPHRTADDETPQRDCPHCGRRDWIDLRRESTALAIRQGEQGVAAAASPAMEAVRNAGFGVIVGAFVGLAATNSFLVGAILAGMAGVAGGLSSYRMRHRALPPKPALPDRWALALPPAGAPTQVTSGRASSTELLRSPLTGRACVAYEVGLRQDAQPTGPLETWALLEQRVAPLDVDGMRVDPVAIFVELPRECLGQLSPEGVEAPAIEWLEERGFSAVGSSLFVYESIIGPDAPISIAISSDGATLSLAPPSRRSR